MYTHTLVYRYGLTAPIENADLVYAQLRAGHEYRCALVRIERQRRAEERAAHLSVSAEVAAAHARVVQADAECEEIASRIRAARKSARKRAETTDMRAELEAARQRHSEMRSALFAVRERYKSQCKECRNEKSEVQPCPHASPEGAAFRLVLDAISARNNAEISKARAASGLYWGTYLVIEKAMAASRAAPLYEKDGITPCDPSFPRFDGGGAFGVQFQSGRPPVFARHVTSGENTRLQITLPPWPEQWLASQPAAEAAAAQDPITNLSALPPGVRPDGTPAPATRPDGTPARWVRRRANKQALLRMCIKTEGRDNPVWASWRLDYDRPIPPQAVITWATVHRRMRGPHSEWSLCVTVDVPATEQTEIRTGVVAVDVGWRLMPCSRVDCDHASDCRELRVAAWRDDKDRSGELRLTATDIRALRQSEQLRSKRDTQFDVIKAIVLGWIKTAQDAPEWMTEAAKTMHTWRRQGRMVALLSRWTEDRPERGEQEEIAYQAAVAWKSADFALWEAERSRDVWAHRRRREIYRVWAAKMAAAYGTIVLEQFDLRDVAERPEVGTEHESKDNDTARSNRQLVAVSELRGALCNAVRSRGAEVVTVTAVNSTRTCPSCGVIADRGQEDAVRLVCVCGHAWDQDTEGAAPWLLREFRERPGDATYVAGARADAIAAEKKGKKGAKWARAKRMSATKKSRLQAAREAAPSGAE
jgi:hypothetical protein